MSTTFLNGLLLLLAATSLLHLVDSSDNSDSDKGTEIDASEYPVCGEKYQSPVDIKVESTEFASAYAGLKFKNYDKAPEFKLINTGHTVQANLMSHTKTIGIYDGGLSKTYYLEQFHFHWGARDRIGSEHTVDGKAYVMEMHLVHYSEDYNNVSAAANKTGGLAVLGMFIEIGNESAAFSKLISQFGNIPKENDEVNMTETFSLNSLLPSNTDDYYLYNGSLTTAPCYQSVNWTVFKEPLSISATQMMEFRKLYDTSPHMRNNFRPVKPLNGRIMYRSFESTASAAAGVFSCSTFVLLYSTIFVFAAAIMAI